MGLVGECEIVQAFAKSPYWSYLEPDLKVYCYASHWFFAHLKEVHWTLYPIQCEYQTAQVKSYDQL